jgi:hypothetical protein
MIPGARLAEVAEQAETIAQANQTLERYDQERRKALATA